MRSTDEARDGCEHEQFVKNLVLEYIQGKRTAEEIRSLVTAAPRRSPLLDRCVGVGSLPQQLLEVVGLSAYDMEISFEAPLVTTRRGLQRNLELVGQGRLAIEALCEWSTDRLAWDIVEGQGCEDEVVRVLANEFTHGEDYAKRITSSPSFLSLFSWHLDHTPPQLASITRIGVFIEHGRASLRDILLKRPTAKSADSNVESALVEFFGPVAEYAPNIVQDFISALRQLGDRAAAQRIDDLITCTTRINQPVKCAEEVLAAERLE